MQDYAMKNRVFIENKRYEIHDGRIYNMAGTSTNHSHITINLALIFGNYLKGKKCRVFGESENVILKKGIKLPLRTRRGTTLPLMLLPR